MRGSNKLVQMKDRMCPAVTHFAGAEDFRVICLVAAEPPCRAMALPAKNNARGVNPPFPRPGLTQPPVLQESNANRSAHCTVALVVSPHPVALVSRMVNLIDRMFSIENERVQVDQSISRGQAEDNVLHIRSKLG